MKVGDIWRDEYGDYILIVNVYKYNTRSKDKKFFIMLDALLLSSFGNLPNDKFKSGDIVEDYNPDIIKEKIA
jgi:hypothetical protein